MLNNKVTVVLIVYNRADKTRQTLDALKKAISIDRCNLLVVQQSGSEEVSKLVNDISWIETTYYRTQYSDCKSVKYRINCNVRKGLELAFANLNCEHAVILEDDILLGYDFLHFCSVMHERYKDDPKFRGINAFSKERYDKNALWAYGRFRYGVGKGWSISRKQWQSVQRYWTPNVDQHFDYLIEEWTREGFVVMPYCSRSLDIGWGEGSSHGPKDEFDEHWVAMRKSWVGSDPFPIKDYECLEGLPFAWRNDCLPYKNNFSQQLALYRLKAKNVLKRFIGR